MNHDSMSGRTRSKLQGVLGGRFIERTRGELSIIGIQWRAARDGDLAAIEKLLQFAHRVAGAGAMLGFEQVSEPMRSIERILRAGVLSSSDWHEVDMHLQALENAMNDAEESLTT